MTSRTQQHRTSTVNGAPANNSLAPGELYVEMADPAKIWVGVPTALAAAGVKKLADMGSPIFSGNPTAPTPPQDDNDTSIATTAYVISQAATVAPLVDSVAAVGTSLRWARQDHVHPTGLMGITNGSNAAAG